VSTEEDKPVDYSHSQSDEESRVDMQFEEPKLNLEQVPDPSRVLLK